MADLVTLSNAKQHLHVVGNDRDADIALKVSQASAIVVDYLKTTASAAWDDTTAPAPVQAATLVLVGHLYENRGDNMETDENLWASLSRYLIRFRDPALA